MKKLFIITFIFFLLLFSIISYYKGSPTGKTITKTKTYTKVICNETNFCQEYLIECYEGKIEKMVPIENASIQHSDEWIDYRKNSSYNLC